MRGELTVGADPELFLTLNGIPVSVEGLLGGTKQRPVPVFMGAVQEDNVLAEFNIDPAHSEDEFISSILTVRRQLEDMLKPYQLVAVPSMEFPKDILKASKQAMTFGCSPDLNAYTGEINRPPNPKTTLRTAGGHVHIGHPLLIDDFELQVAYIKKLDEVLGDKASKYDKDTRRKELYGTRGSFRSKPYGVEYRVLSNFWLQKVSYMKWVYRGVHKAWNQL